MGEEAGFGRMEKGLGGSLRIVVSGAAGFIGSHMCDRLLAEGHAVEALDNFLTGSRRNVAHLAGEPRFRLLERDITRPFAIEGPVDCVVNMASPASPKDYLEHPIETLDVGSLGTRRMLELALEKGARFLLTSTSECYGDPELSPQPETYWGRVNSVGPRSVYDEAKRFSEAMTMAFYRSRGVDTRIVRIFNTYGPRMRLNDGRALPNFLYQALHGKPITVYGDGSQTRSFCYVSDLIEGIWRLMQSDEHLPVNIGNPHEITIREFAERIKALTESPVPIIFQPLPQDDPKQRRPDIEKARKLLGWEPKVELQQGLDKTLAYFRELLARQTTTSSNAD